MERSLESSGHSAKRVRVVSCLTEGPSLPVELCNIILDYSSEFEGRRTHEITLQWECNAMVEIHGKIALGCSDTMVRVLDLASGECVQTLAGHTRKVTVLAVMPDGKLVSGSNDNTVRVWENDRCAFALVGHTDWVSALTVLSDGKLASGSWDKTVRVWDVASSACLLNIFAGSYVHALAALPDGKLASCSGDDKVRVWKEDGTCLSTISGHTSMVRTLVLLPDGRLVSCADDRTLCVWDTASGSCTTLLKKHTQWVRAVAVMHDGKLATGSVDKRVRVWDATSERCLMTLSEDFIVIALLALASGKLAVTSRKTLNIYE